jgi:radical SAM superfamily enzyme YgiQ (UPF0313 family)
VSSDLVSIYRSRLFAEKGYVKKDPGGRLSVALSYPNYYSLGMSNLGFQTVYGLLNDREDVLAERVFLPEGNEMSLYLQTGHRLMSLESQRSLDSFEIVAFSIPFENDYANILTMLSLGGLPLRSSDRAENQPIIMAGGITTFLNPEPLSDIIDLFLLGEAEAVLSPFIDRLVDSLRRGKPRSEILRELARSVPGTYVPSLYRPSYNDEGVLASFEPLYADGVPSSIRAVKASLSSKGVARSIITSADTEFGNKVLLEASRGCGHSCRFCAAGFVYRPPRLHPEETLSLAVQGAMSYCNQIGLIAAAVSDVPGIESITGGILEKGASFSVSSLRAENLTKGLLDHLRASGQKTVTIAPEAGSERLRRVINKHLTEEQILDSATLISRAGGFSLRLYFLIGLPTETQEDIEAIPELVKKIKHRVVKESAGRGKIAEMRLSINCFVPKPFTPFQWHPMDEMVNLKEKQRWLKNALSREGGVKTTFDVPKWAYLQALLCLGDRRVGGILLKAHRLDWNWKAAFRSSEVNPDFFVLRPKDLHELLPWDFIDHGLSKRHLSREYETALKAGESEICKVGKCVRCGVCKVYPQEGGEKIEDA